MCYMNDVQKPAEYDITVIVVANNNDSDKNDGCGSGEWC